MIDFGLAREVDTTAHFTSAGELVGTVAYLAPESHPVRTLRELPLEPPLAAADATRVGVVAEGERIRLYRDGLLQMRPEDRPPYRVSFADVEIWGGGG